jgi:ligand-binding sensor domain-containing protein
VGSFQHGLDQIGPDGLNCGHWLDDNLWQINRMVAPDPARTAWPGLLVASSRGVFHQDERGNFEAISLGESKASSPRIQSLLVTSKGLAAVGKDGLRLIGRHGRVRLFSGFHGLPSSKAYCLASRGKELFVGTLAGLARLHQGKLRRTWRAASSQLQSGWIQSLSFGGSSLWIGTFGGGVHRLNEDFLEPVPLAEGPKDINPNAMVFHRGRLYTGSSGEGVSIHDEQGRLRGTLRRGLPSWDVQSLTATRKALVIGCTNGVVILPWDQIEEVEP